MDNDSTTNPFHTNPTTTTTTSILPTITNVDDTLSSSPRRRRSRLSRRDDDDWPTIDGPLGLSNDEDALTYARRFFILGFLCLPFLWAVNCFYFWPVLRRPDSRHPNLRCYLLGSAIGFLLSTAILSSWALCFAIGGEHLFGGVWEQLVMYNVADRYGLTGWM